MSSQPSWLDGFFGNGAGGGHALFKNGVALPQRPAIDFKDVGVSVADNPSTQRTEVDIPGAPSATSSVQGKVKLTKDIGGTADLPEVIGLRGVGIGVLASRAAVGQSLAVDDDGEYVPIRRQVPLRAFGARRDRPVEASTNASPIVLTLTGHEYVTGDTVVVSGHATNTGANGSWTVTAVDANHISLNGSTGTGVGVATGTASTPVQNSDALDAAVASIPSGYELGAAIYPEPGTYTLARTHQRTRSRIRFIGDSHAVTVFRLSFDAPVCAPTYLEQPLTAVALEAGAMGGQRGIFPTGAFAGVSTTPYVVLTDAAGIGAVDGSTAWTLELDYTPSNINARCVIASAGRMQRAVDTDEAFSIGHSLPSNTNFVATIGGVRKSLSCTGTSTAGALHKVAMSHDGTTLRVYVNGTLAASTGAVGTLTQKLYEQVLLGKFGRGAFETDSYADFEGTIEQVRFSKIARYTGASYVPSATKWVWDSNTTFLLTFSEVAGSLVKARTSDSGSPIDAWLPCDRVGYGDSTDTLQDNGMENITWQSPRGTAMRISRSNKLRMSKVHAYGTSQWVVRNNCWHSRFDACTGAGTGLVGEWNADYDRDRLGADNGIGCHDNVWTGLHIYKAGFPLVVGESDCSIIGGSLGEGAGVHTAMVLMGSGSSSSINVERVKVSDEDQDTPMTRCLIDGGAAISLKACEIENSNLGGGKHLVVSKSPFGETDITITGGKITTYNGVGTVEEPIAEVIEVVGDAPLIHMPSAPQRQGAQIPWTLHASMPIDLPRGRRERATVAVADADLTLTREQSLYRGIEFTGTLTAPRRITFPAVDHYEVRVANLTDDDLTFVAAGGTWIVTVPATYRAIISCDGTNLQLEALTAPPTQPAGYDFVNDPAVLVCHLDVHPTLANTTRETISGSEYVTSITDESTFANNAAQATSAKKPLFTAVDADFNNEPSFTCDGSNDFLLSTLETLTGTQAVVFVVAQRLSNVAFQRVWSFADAGAAQDYDNNNSAILFENASTTIDAYRNGAVKSSVTNPGTGNAFVSYVRFDGTNATVRAAGATGTPGASSAAFNASEFRIGAGKESSTEVSFANYKYARVLVYYGDDAADIAAIGAALATKYGATF